MIYFMYISYYFINYKYKTNLIIKETFLVVQNKDGWTESLKF